MGFTGKCMVTAPISDISYEVTRFVNVRFLNRLLT
jgi:hypothetical protein